MKNRLIAIVLFLILLVSLILPIREKVYADGFTLAMASALNYAVGSSAGLDFVFSSAGYNYSQSFMEQGLDNYMQTSGKSLSEIFGTEVLRVEAGKLAAGQRAYNGAVEFLNWLVDAYNINMNDLTNLGGDSTFNPPGSESQEYAYGTSCQMTILQNQLGNDYYYPIAYDVNGDPHYFGGGEKLVSNYPSYTISVDRVLTNTLYWKVRYVNKSGTASSNSAQVTRAVFNTDIGARLSNSYVRPIIIDPSQEWLGQVGDYQDTNLDQLLGHIFEDAADNNLVVEGEVIDIPIPPPTPEPIDPDTPLSDVPWEGLDNNLQQLYEQGLEEIGAIGDAQDAITDAVADQTGALEDALADNAGVVSGAIGQAVSDIQDSISEQTETLSESATATAAAAEAIEEALEDETINWQKFDLRGLFPFCIPFDIYNMLEALDASPTAPHVQLPFVIDSINFSYIIDLDFSAFDQVAAVMRQMELIAYAIALAWATSKVIKW